MNEISNEDHLLYVLTRSGCEESQLEVDEYKEIFQVYKILVLFIAPVNILLNGISLNIFGHRMWKNSSTSAILKSLSVFEICFASSLFLHTINSRVLETYTHLDNQTAANLTDKERLTRTKLVASMTVSQQILSGFLFAFQVARNWSVVLLAAYRYDAICRKIGTVSSFPRERIPWIMTATMILSGLFALPRLFEIRSFLCVPTVIIYNEEPLLAKNLMYQLLYLGIGTFIVQSGGPVLCVCILSFFVIRKIALRRKFRRQNQRTVFIMPSGNEDNSCTEPQTATKTVERKLPSGDKLMLALCFMFFVLETPAFFSKILSSYTSTNYPTLDVYMSVIANLLIYLDSTVNVFVYMGSNPTFRTVAKLMFSRGTNNTQAKSNISRTSEA
nr:Orphan Rhodopsin-like G protein-coupled receptor [Hymenolepis microstoma]